MECCSDREDAVGVVAQFVCIERVVVDCGGHVEAHRTALSRLVGVDVGGRLFDPLGSEVRRSMESGDGLDDAAVGASEGSDLAVGPLLCGDPFDGVESVFAFPEVAGVIVAAIALGLETAPEVLDDQGVSVAGIVVADGVILRIGLVVRGADEEGWDGIGDEIAVGSCREEDVRGETDAVAHGDHEFGVMGVGIGCGHGWLLARWDSLFHDTIGWEWAGGCPHPGTLPPGGRGDGCYLRGFCYG